MSGQLKQNLAMAGVAVSGLIWGVLWIPLRALSESGLSDLWSIVLFYVVPVVVLSPLYIIYSRKLWRGGWSLNIAGLLAGSALVLYAGALLFTNVVHAMLLYYLTPLWSTLLARALLGETISQHRWITMALAFAGMLVILKIDSGLPWPQNAGDWMGLASGAVWALAAVHMRRTGEGQGIEFSLSYFVWGSIAALLLTLLPIESSQAAPTLQTIQAALPWLIPVIIFMVIPAAVLVMWGATVLSPGILGILFMTEISAGTVTAAIWAGEPFGVREILGVSLISLAGLWEPLQGLRRQ